MLSRQVEEPFRENELTTTHQGTLAQSCQVASCQIAEPLWTDPGKKSGISVLELISAKKIIKKKKKQM